MRLALVCFDTHGGVQPFLALARRFCAEGVAVVIVAPKNYRGIFQGTPVEFVGLEADIKSLLEGEENKGLAEESFLKTHIKVMALAREALTEAFTVCLKACQGADAILGALGGQLMSHSVAEKLAIPFIQMHLQPLTPTAQFPGVVGSPWLGAKLSHRLTQQVFWQPLRPFTNKARQRILGLPKAPFFGYLGRPGGPSAPVIYGFSPTVIPPPSDWPSDVHVAGYWFVDEDPGYTPPPGLVAFLEAGKIPIAIGFGSMVGKDPEATTELLLEGIEAAGERAVLISGWGGIGDVDLPDTVYRVERIPHSWLFPRVSLSVHHGGAGTTGATVRAGIPSVVIPFNADQPLWGGIVHRKGIAPTPIPRPKLTAQSLAQAIRGCLDDPDVVSEAKRIGELVREEDGTGRALALIRSALES